MNENLKDLFARLAEPFHPQDIEWRAGSTNADKTRALAMAYITSRAVMDRLDEVIGPENWKDQYAPGPDGGVICGLSLHLNGEWITKWDGAENTDFEAIKGGLSDAFKRAGYKWGIGRYLYKLDSVWVPCELAGKTVVLKSTPPLPEWALPKGFTKTPTGARPNAKAEKVDTRSEREKQILAELGFEDKPQGNGANGTNGSNSKRPMSWGSEIVKAVLNAKLAGTAVEAVQLLNNSGLEPHATPEQAIESLKATHQG